MITIHYRAAIGGNPPITAGNDQIILTPITTNSGTMDWSCTGGDVLNKYLSGELP